MYYVFTQYSVLYLTSTTATKEEDDLPLKRNSKITLNTVLEQNNSIWRSVSQK